MRTAGEVQERSLGCFSKTQNTVISYTLIPCFNKVINLDLKQKKKLSKNSSNVVQNNFRPESIKCEK